MDYQPNADYLQAAPGNAAGNLVMILPASGLMQSAFGDIDEQGLSVDGLKIFCQNQQEVKAAAIGEVIEVVSGAIGTGFSVIIRERLSRRCRWVKLCVRANSWGGLLKAHCFFRCCVMSSRLTPFCL